VIDAYAPGAHAGPPTDAGGTPTDAGGTPADAGSTPADAGSAPADAGMVKTLSVDFSSTVTGTVSFDVDTIDTSGCIVGQGHTDVVIRKGAVAEGSVALTPQPPHDCNGDGGSPDGSPDASDGGPTFPGCDPMSPQTGAGLQCATGQVCQVDCPLNKTDCVQGGTGVPGSTCRNNADCAPGTQCFDYSTLGCMGTKVCLEFWGRRLREPLRRARPVRSDADHLSHLHVQLRPDGGGGRDPRRLPRQARVRDAGEHGRGRLRLPRDDPHQARGTGLHGSGGLRARPHLQSDERDEDLPPHLPLPGRERRVHRRRRHLPDRDHHLPPGHERHAVRRLLLTSEPWEGSEPPAMSSGRQSRPALDAIY
jgi:hypothetical protein